MLVVMMEAIAATWVNEAKRNGERFSFSFQVYGLSNLVNDIRANLGFAPNYFFRIAWSILCPSIVTLLMILSIIDSAPLTYGQYVYPLWSIVLGWCMNMAFIVPIPLVMIYAFIRYSDSKTSFKERLRLLFVPTINKPRVKSLDDSANELNPSSPISQI